MGQYQRGYSTELSGSSPSEMCPSSKAQGILFAGTCWSQTNTLCASRVGHIAFLEHVIVRLGVFGRDDKTKPPPIM